MLKSSFGGRRDGPPSEINTACGVTNGLSRCATEGGDVLFEPRFMGGSKALCWQREPFECSDNPAHTLTLDDDQGISQATDKHAQTSS